MTERQWQQRIVDYAVLRGWLVYHTHDSRHSPKGWPDLALVRDGVLICAELKVNRGRVSPAQAAWLAALGDVPAVTAEIWRPSDWQRILDVLR